MVRKKWIPRKLTRTASSFGERDERATDRFSLFVCCVFRFARCLCAFVFAPCVSGETVRLKSTALHLFLFCHRGHVVFLLKHGGTGTFVCPVLFLFFFRRLRRASRHEARTKHSQHFDFPTWKCAARSDPKAGQKRRMVHRELVGLDRFGG